MEFLDHVGQELVVAEALAGEVDRTHGELLPFVRRGYQPAERVLDHPAVDRRHQPVAFGGGDEVVGRDDLAGFIAHAQQDLVVQTLFVVLQRPDHLPVDIEAAFLERRVDARGPLHLAPAAHEIDVILFERVHTIATEFLRRLARTLGGGHQRSDVAGIGRDRHDADRRTEPERPVFPGEPEVAHRFAQGLGRAQRLVQRATLEQDAELIAADPRQRVAPANL